MKKHKIAAILMIIHGGFMEVGGILAMIPALMFGTDKFDIGKYFEFKFQYFQENLYLMMIMGAMYGVLRLIGAIGLLKNRMWGVRVISNKLYYYNCPYDVFAASRNHGWNTCWYGIGFNIDAILW